MSAPDTLPLRLTERQQDLLLHALGLPQDLADKLADGEPEDDMRVFELTRDDLNDLAEFAAGEANHTANRELEAEYETILRRIEGLLNLAGPDPRVERTAVPEPLLDALKRIVQDPSVTSIEDLVSRVEEIALAKAGEPQEDLEGLTPVQAMRLVESEWSPEGSTVLLNTRLRVDEVKGASVFHNARILLAAIRDEGPVKATQSGNLTRRFMEGLLDRLDLPAGYLDAERSVSKAINEINIYPLHMARVLAEAADFLVLEGGRFSVTPVGEELLGDDGAGEFYARLFYALYRQVNLDYFDRMVEVPAVQEGMAYSLYAIARLADDWQREDALTERIFLPYVRMSIPENHYGESLAPALAYTRVFHHLHEFGLLQRREVSDPSALLGVAGEVRKTPLYDRFLRFDLDREPE